ncbi:MAG: ATP-binding protein [Bacteroidetes bacterium]|nr:ATP-binding protein [Bacteroidota bacterium]
MKKKTDKCFEKEQSQLIIIYGRRRIGKSALIAAILPENSIFFMADQSDASIQRFQLARMIAEEINGFDKIVYPDWDALFQNLANSLQRKITISLDEFPYLVKNSPELPSIIQRVCDKGVNKNFHLILCGSSQQMMRSLILNYNSPLYGRATEILRLKGMNVFWLKEALACTDEQAIIEYSIWGGIARYWQIRSEEKDLNSAILNNVLDKSGILHEEPIRLFIDEMRESVLAFSILNMIGNGANRLSEIAGRLNKPASSLSGTMQVLIELGFIRREIPFGTSLKSTKKTLYKISDQFMLFYFRLVNPNLSRLELDMKEQVLNNNKE